MIALIIVLAYLLVGGLAARKVFVYTLGSAKRFKDYGNYWTSEYIGAVWLAIGTLFAWPIFVPIRLITSATPYEKLLQEKAAARELDAEMRSLEKRYGLEFNK